MRRLGGLVSLVASFVFAGTISCGSEENTVDNSIIDPYECITIPRIEYDAGGTSVRDQSDLNGEYFVLENLCSKLIDMTNWRIEDNDDHSYIFPAFMLFPGASVRIHSGAGEDTDSVLHWGSTRYPVLNNNGDNLTFYDETGTCVMKVAYAPSDREALINKTPCNNQ